MNLQNDKTGKSICRPLPSTIQFWSPPALNPGFREPCAELPGRLHLLDDSVVLTDCQDLINVNVGEFLDFLRRGPFHFNQVHFRGFANAKVQPQVTLRHHARPAVDLIHLPVLASGHISPCTNGRAVARGSNQFEFNPIVLVPAVIAEQ